MNHADKPIVLQVVEAFGGGVFHSTAQVCCQLKDDFQFVVLYSVRAETPENYKDYFPDDTHFIKWCATREVNPKMDNAAIKQLRNVVKATKPVCIHAHSSKAGALARLAFPLGGHRIYYSPRAYGCLQRDLSFPKRCFYALAEFALGFLPHNTIACGKGEYNISRFLCLPWQRKLIPNAVDMTHLTSIYKTVKPKKTFTVVSSGRFLPQKNFPLFVAIARQFEADDVPFIWVGGDKEAACDLPKNVTVTGWLDHAESLKIIASGHVYLQPSLWEGLPRTVLEAMGLGKAAVVSHVNGNKELVENGRTGYVCTSVDEYAEAINALKQNKAWQRCGKNARDYIQTYYSYAATMPKWRNLYLLGNLYG